MSEPDEPDEQHEQPESPDLRMIINRSNFINGYCRCLSDVIKIIGNLSTSHHKVFMASKPEDTTTRIQTMFLCKELNDLNVKLFDMMNTTHMYQTWDDHVAPIAPKESSK